MSDETKLMEGEIIAEENLADSKQQTNPQTSTNLASKIPAISPQSLKNKLTNFKKPKIITIVILIALIFLSLIALIVLGSKPPEEQIVNPDVFVTSPKPTPQVSEEVKEINTGLEMYQKKIDGLNESINNYPPPNVDLEISF